LNLAFGDGTGDTFEVNDAEIAQMDAHPSRLLPVSLGRDLHKMAATLPNYPNPAAGCIRIWRDSERFVADVVPRLTRWPLPSLPARILAMTGQSHRLWWEGQLSSSRVSRKVDIGFARECCVSLRLGDIVVYSLFVQSYLLAR
jgi:hypothetical protein